MKKYKYITAIIMLPFILSSCEKLIDVEMPANQIESEAVFADAQTADAALAGVYAGLWSSSPISGDKLSVMLSLYTDDLDFYATASTNGMMEVYTNQLIQNNAIVYGQWSTAYQYIYSCNAIIEGCSQSLTLGEDAKKRIIGEALSLRSVLFFYLQQLFGDIPYPTSTDYKVNQALSKKTRDEVLQLLETDLSKSADALSDTYRNTERIYVNKKVVQLFLAKVFMLEKKYDQAESIFKTIINSGMYQIQNDLTKTFKKSGTNILWQLKPTNTSDPTKEVLAYYFDYIPPYNYALSNNLINIFSSSDQRKQNWTLPVTVAGTTWYRANKYKNHANNSDEYSIVCRIEEVYLLLSEALTQQNKISEALPYLNATRLRSGLTAIAEPISKENLLDEILGENRKEFFTETGHRFFDLKRLNKLDALTTTKPNWKSYFSLWPIPEKELLLNPNLNPQNNGY